MDPSQCSFQYYLLVFVFLILFLVVFSSLLTSIAVDLLICLWYSKDRRIYSCSPQYSVSSIIKVGKTSALSFQILRLSVKTFHRSIRQACIVCSAFIDGSSAYFYYRERAGNAFSMFLKIVGKSIEEFYMGSLIYFYKLIKFGQG